MKAVEKVALTDEMKVAHLVVSRVVWKAARKADS